MAVIDATYVYGARELTMSEVRDALEAISDLRFALHESLYMGGDYLRAERTDIGELVTIQPNVGMWGDEDDPYAEPDYPDHVTVLCIESTERIDVLTAWLERVDGLEFLYGG